MAQAITLQLCVHWTASVGAWGMGQGDVRLDTLRIKLGTAPRRVGAVSATLHCAVSTHYGVSLIAAEDRVRTGVETPSARDCVGDTSVRSTHDCAY